jgi:hypothetical protein
MTFNEKVFAVNVAFVCVLALAVIGLIVAGWVWPRVGMCIGTLLAGCALWFTAWQSGRCFEREHGQRKCGAESPE